MTIRELKEKLENKNPDMKVCIVVNEDSDDYQIKEITHMNLCYDEDEQTGEDLVYILR